MKIHGYQNITIMQIPTRLLFLKSTSFFFAISYLYLQEYQFTDDNPMANIQRPLEKGKELLEQGDLPGAVLCFEVAVKSEPQNAEAWLLLGTTQAENEQVCFIKVKTNKSY